MYHTWKVWYISPKTKSNEGAHVVSTDDRVRHVGVRGDATADEGGDCGGLLREVDGALSHP